MSDLIRRDAVIDALLLEFPQINMPIVQIALERVPAVDAVEVVRCGNCEYWKKRFVNSKGFVICPASGMNITADDFCSYGERREEE